MNIYWKSLLWNLALPLLTGGLAALITQGSMEQFAQLNQPPLSPPGWLFPVVWTILYTLMGISSYLIQQSDSPDKNTALR
ncbi:MAG: tryptophan-rich sensory protein, partial [Ruminococcaceae bacterium]|nr:tryptophan-rich sensory protein [Oscillospiraceae bacterium]